METTTNYLTKAQYRNDKTRLTRAVNSGNHERIIRTVQETYANWDLGRFAWPDDWHRWERAMRDAEHALRLAA